MTNVVDQSAWWNPLLTSEIFAWLGGTTTYICCQLVYCTDVKKL